MLFRSKQIEEKKSPEHFSETLEEEKREKELLAVELRLLKGVDLSKRAPLSKELLRTIKRLVQEGLLEEAGSRLRLSAKGLLFYDTVASEIV